MDDIPGRLVRRWQLVGVAGFVAAAAVYLLAVLTPTGQRLENAALRGADQAGAQDRTAADDGLAEITVYSLAVAVVVVAVIALLRRRLDLAVAGVGVIVAGQVITQVLKRWVLPRPELVPVTGDYAHNSLPSGHTTIAMTVLFAVLIVVPYRWRGVALFLVLSWAVGIGAYTVTAKWHRLSDTLAADGIALGVACAASWWLARRGLVQRHEGRSRIARSVIVGFTAAVGVATLVLSMILLVVPIVRFGLHETITENTWVLYLSTHSLASFGSIFAALVFLATWRRVEIR